MTNLSVKLGNNVYNNCLFNASGCWCTTEAELNQLVESSCGGVISKSSTILPRVGNPEPRLFFDIHGSINSMGIPNYGFEFYSGYRNYALKPFIQSVMPFTKDDLRIMLQYCNDHTVYTDTGIEINMSCPNIVGSDFSELDHLEEYTRFISDNDYNNLLIGFKLPPYFYPQQFDKVYDILNGSKIKFITCINSLPNGLLLDGDTVAIKPKKGLGGIGGLYCKPTALANVYSFHNLFGDNMFIFGCGGVQSGKDAYEHILCGASAVQIGTQLMIEGPSCFLRIQRELRQIMKNKNHTCIGDFRGKVESFS